MINAPQRAFFTYGTLSLLRTSRLVTWCICGRLRTERTQQQPRTAIMSVKLVQLLELSYDLSRGRKRRIEWEALAEKNQSTAIDCEPADEGSAADEDCSDDVAERTLLGTALRARGLAPRAPDAEHAFLRLLCAERSAKVQKLEGSDFDWLVCPVAESATSSAEILCPPKAGGTALGSDDTFARLLAVSACDGVSVDPLFARIETEVFNTDVPRSPAPGPHSLDVPEERAASARLPEALERLCALVTYGSSDDAASTDSSADEFWDSETDSLNDDDLEFVAEVTQEAMTEAEREECEKLLAEKSASEVADAVNKCSISAC